MFCKMERKNLGGPITLRENVISNINEVIRTVLNF